MRNQTGVVLTQPSTGVPWFIPLAEGTEGPARILGLPQAGGGCSAFVDCAGRLGPDVTMWGLNLPGRQARFNEPPRTDIESLVGEIVATLDTGWLDRPYALFGYCSGALLAFLVARAIRAEGLPAPSALVVASYPAPHLVRPPEGVHLLATDPFWTEILSYGGFPAELADQPDYREIFEPALRADYEMLAGFHHVDGPPLATPIVAIGGRHDPVLGRTDLLGWADQTTAEFSMHLLDGDHWLLETAAEGVAGILDRGWRR